MGVIFVIAADSALRRSLKFALEAEHLTVHAYDGLESARRSRLLDQASCAVVDEDVLDGRGAATAALKRFARPVILLVDRPPGCAGHDELAILVKPLQWDALIRTVQAMTRDTMPPGPAGVVADQPDDGSGRPLPAATT
ncbi:hypothetical protein GTW51_14295 [Aurantimonas aggregata]|uniref:Response regulatory domain-containing protein n=1 Tax=Aurantimonas aggregata TaxID=2047720 RepID=A0A6L9MJ16_9HYPH|nr:hypothetical protein [Aurantimonas aggregata]NDV87874.1 hypothetical protein [Aurantimonas aggregata]